MQPTGLSSEQASALRDQVGPNLIPSEKPRGIFALALDVVKEPMLLLLIAAALISFTLGEPAESAILTVGVVLVVSISLFQTIRTDRALESLKQLAAPRVLVLRDGAERYLSSFELVPGDLIIVREGDRISADAVLIQVSNLRIDESILTGESLALEKQVGDEVLSGTVVLLGHGLAQVLRTGKESKIGQIGTLLLTQGDVRTPLQREVSRLVRVIGTIAVVAAVSVTLIYSLTRNDWLTGALAGISASMALLPEELPIVLTVFLGLGSLRLSRQRVIVRRSATIEALGSITVLCADKTGTITQNKMVLTDTSPEVTRVGRLACPANPVDPMDKAFESEGSLNLDWKLVREYPMLDGLMAVYQVWDMGTEEYFVAAKGAPEFLITRSLANSSMRDEQMNLVSTSAASGYRVLAVAQGLWERSKPLPESPVEFNLEFLGLAKLADPVREGVEESIALLKEAGIRTIMITGDHPGTASFIARQIGLENPSDVITGKEVQELSDEELGQALRRVSVFSRTLPEQKLRIVSLLQSAGEVVAMTGDGVNDAPALKRAHVGISMGVRGSEVAREASDMVVTDDSFISIANGIAEGRRIYGNLKKAATYIVAIHVPIFTLALVPILQSAWPLVLLPAQIAILELLIDPASSVAYQSEGEEVDQMRERPRPVDAKLLDKETLQSALLQGVMLSIAALVIFAWSITSFSEGQVRLLVFITLLAGNLFLMVSNRSTRFSFLTLLTRRNRAAAVLFTLGTLMLIAIATLPGLQAAFRVEGAPLQSVAMAAAVSLLPVLAHEILKYKKRKQFAKAVSV